MNCLFADPTTEKKLPLIDAAAEAGAEYFVMDYAMLSRLSIQSASDQPHYDLYPSISAMAPSVVAPEQAEQMARERAENKSNTN